MNPWKLTKDSVSAFMADGALSQGAAIAYYTIFSIAPVLIIVIAVAGLAFGHDAAQGAIVQQLSGLMGHDSADALQGMIKSADSQKSGIIATVLGVGTLIVTASGVFGQMQSSLNLIWKAEPKADLSRLVKARIASMGLVMTLGFLLMVSLVISAVLSTLDKFLNGLLPGAHILMQALNFVISLALISVLFAAIYKVLPDKKIDWRDVIVGAVTTAFLFTVGKSLIGLYIGHSNIASSYGGAGAFVIILLWIYYSSQIFLFGAEFTRVYAETHGSHSPSGKNSATAGSTSDKAVPAPETQSPAPPQVSRALPLKAGTFVEQPQSGIKQNLTARIAHHKQKAISSVVTYGLAAVVSLIALIFMFVLLDRWLSDEIGPIGSAAVIIGITLLAIAVLFVVKAARSGGARGRR